MEEPAEIHIKSGLLALCVIPFALAFIGVLEKVGVSPDLIGASPIISVAVGVAYFLLLKYFKSKS